MISHAMPEIGLENVHHRTHPTTGYQFTPGTVYLYMHRQRMQC